MNTGNGSLWRFRVVQFLLIIIVIIIIIIIIIKAGG